MSAKHGTGFLELNRSLVLEYLHVCLIDSCCHY